MNPTLPRLHRLLTCSVVGSTLLLGACQKQPEAETEYHHLSTAVVAERHDQFEIQRDFAGLIVPAQTTDLGFELNGQIDSLDFEEGESVQQGQVLATLDTQLLQAEQERLNARQAELQASLTLNQANLRRAQDLKEKGFTSDQNIDELVAQQQQIEAGLEQVAADLSSNQTRLDKSQLIAPYSGVISRRLQDDGAVVSAGMPVFRLLDHQELEARIGIPVRMRGQVSLSDTVSIESAGEVISGRIVAIGSDVTRATLTVPVRIALPSDIHAIAGDQAYLKLNETIDSPGFWVPLTSLTDGIRGLWNIYVMTPQQDSSLFMLESRDVRVHHIDDQRAFISGALGDGELIVSGGLHRLVPGQSVRLEKLEDRAG